MTIRDRRKPLDGKTAIVTGASSGIGRATALALARAGAGVVLAARRQTELACVADEIRSCGQRALVIPTDVTDEVQVRELVGRTVLELGRIDIVVANAGSYVRCPIQDANAELFERSLRVNFYGSLYLVLAVLPHLTAQRSGHLVLVSSMDGKKGLPNDAPYVAAKFALAGFGDVLRQELYDTGVGVTTVFPGRVDTPMIAELAVPRISAKIGPEAVADEILQAILARRAEVIVPAQAQLLRLLNGLSPSLGDWAVRTFGLVGREAR